MQWRFSGKQEIYLEIAEQYENYIKKGVLRKGEKLPSIRHAAADLGVNPNTMAHAYAVLEERRLIASLPKKGVYVIFEGETDSEVSEERPLPADCRMAIAQWKRLGIRQEELLQYMKEVYEQND